MEKINVYVVSDDAAVCDSIKDLLEPSGMKAQVFESLHTYCSMTEPHSRGCLVLDTHNIDLGESSQVLLLESVCAAMSVILITDRGDVLTAVRGMKLGATDIVQKPYRTNRLLDSVRQAIDTEKYSKSNRSNLVHLNNNET
jgi:two-component system C4-dicarboxylate transport response regulator DctD